MQKSLDQMNLQIHHVISDITGVTGLAIVDAIVAGNTNPEALAKLAGLPNQSVCRNGNQELGWGLSCGTHLYVEAIVKSLPLLPATHCRLRSGSSTTHRIL